MVWCSCSLLFASGVLDASCRFTDKVRRAWKAPPAFVGSSRAVAFLFCGRFDIPFQHRNTKRFMTPNRTKTILTGPRLCVSPLAALGLDVLPMCGTGLVL